MKGRLAAAALTLATGACASAPAAPSPVAPGNWGGDHVAMTVVTSAAHLEFDCAHGDIASPLVMDAGGRFAVSGTYTREHGGPIRTGEQPDVHPASYTGTVSGSTMRLTIVLADSNETIGAFTLEYGSSGRVTKCLLPL